MRESGAAGIAGAKCRQMKLGHLPRHEYSSVAEML